MSQSVAGSFRLETQYNKIEEEWMEKKGHVIRTWRKRYFSMDMEKKTLSYFGDEGKTIFKSQYCIDSKSVVTLREDIDGHNYCLSVKAMCNGAESILFMSAEDEEKRDRWYEILSEAALGVKINQPKLCEPFRNALKLEVSYVSAGLSISAHDGCHIGPVYSATMPVVKFPVSPLQHYALILVNPDSPAYLTTETEGTELRRKSIFNSPHRDFVHWVVLNIPSNDMTAGRTVLSYAGACPSFNAGLQRYFFLLFKQDRVLPGETLDEAELYFSQRGGLQSCAWAAQQNFGTPVGVNGFTSEWSEYCDTVHSEIKFMPSEGFRSPAQQVKYEADMAEKKRQTDLQREQRKAAELKQKAEEEGMQELSENAASIAIAGEPDMQSLLSKYRVTTSEIFTGSWVNKKFTSEMMFRKRFVWIDQENSRLYWSKVDKRDDPNKKCIDLVIELGDLKVKPTGFVCLTKELGGKSIEIQITSGDKEKVAADMVKVIETVRADALQELLK